MLSKCSESTRSQNLLTKIITIVVTIAFVVFVWVRLVSPRQNGAMQAPSALSGFEGPWSTTYGRINLRVEGSRVYGNYPHPAGSGIIEGTVDDGLLRFRYTEPGEIAGSGEFQLSQDRLSFAGRWLQDGVREGPLGAQDQAWHGVRVFVESAPSRGPATWLVVLETHWEASLVANEFSYGEMLRAYYRRMPNLQVRHRRIHDRADFSRITQEISRLEGDVYLYISSHGTEAGATLADGSIDAPMMTALLASTSNIKLVHFGSCLVAAGSVPEDTLRALPPRHRVPISGFTQVADWGGSAVVDFAYLDNLLERRLSPADAVAATRRNIIFAGDTAPGPVSPMGLRIVLPSDIKE
jgi:hypothetical protein